MTDLAPVGSVAVLAVSALLGLRMVLKHRERKVEHAPVADLEKRITELERKASANELAKLARR